MKCPRCSFINRTDTLICIRCGYSFKPGEGQPVKGPVRVRVFFPGRKTKKKGVILSARDGLVRLRKDVDDFKRAGFFSRSFAMALDLFFLLMFIGAMISGAGLFIGKSTNLVETVLSSKGIDIVRQAIPYIKTTIGVVAAIPPLYFIVMHAVFGQTIGKMIMGIQVVRTDGGKVGPLISTVRFLGYIISFVLLFFGFFWIIIDRERQGWHDMIADTVVIKL
ncbi:MAG: RDD family protein [Deltaproteobacteria bacterium]|uniref:RDD family protein n=1 Tax=Candidatus Zymogenus saltonus TaxID=2844893 RepID=A0A9D8KF20_9DELT|nr:RDD family protein [Candidatus Zymogenus saltonus]